MAITEKQLELLHRAKKGEERKIVEQDDPPLVVYWRVPPGVLVPFGGGNLRACKPLAEQGYLRREDFHGQHAYRLTSKGEEVVRICAGVQVTEEPLTLTLQVVALRLHSPNFTLTEIANLLDVDLKQITQTIAQRRSLGSSVPRGTATSRGHTGKYTPRKPPSRISKEDAW